MRCRCWRPLTPQLVDQAIHRHGRWRLDEQQRQHSSLACATERHRLAASKNLQSPENLKLHDSPIRARQPIYWHLVLILVKLDRLTTAIPDGLQQPGSTPGPPHAPAPFRLVPTPQAGPTSVGDVVYDQLLEALHQGRLRPGERLHDAEFAAQLDVSRTPVREALIRLGELGVVEFAPARYTRVAIIDQTQTRHAIAAWVTVYAAIAALAASNGLPASTLNAMADAHARFQTASEPYDLQALAAANADFYDLPTRHCDNPMLVRCAERVVHVVRLGILQLPGPLNPAPLRAAQAALLDALAAADPRAARQAVYRIADIPLTRNARQHQ